MKLFRYDLELFSLEDIRKVALDPGDWGAGVSDRVNAKVLFYYVAKAAGEANTIGVLDIPPLPQELKTEYASRCRGLLDTICRIINPDNATTDWADSKKRDLSGLPTKPPS